MREFLFSLFFSFAYIFLVSETSSIVLSERQLCDIELLLNDGYAPLTGFKDKKTYDRVVPEMLLLDNTVWPIPV